MTLWKGNGDQKHGTAEAESHIWTWSSPIPLVPILIQSRGSWSRLFQILSLLGFGYLQVWRLHSPSGPPVPLFGYPHHGKMCPNAQREQYSSCASVCFPCFLSCYGHPTKSLALCPLHHPTWDPLCRVKWGLQGQKAPGKASVWEMQTSRALTEWQRSTAMRARPTLLTWMHFKSHLWMHDCTCQGKQACTSWSTRHNHNKHGAFPRKTGFFHRKNTPGAAMLYGNYGLGSFPESRLPLFLIICYSSLFQSKMRSDLWEITYKMKHGNMGWMMINGSYDMCLQKCKRAQTSRRGRLTWGDTRGFSYE